MKTEIEYKKDCEKALKYIESCKDYFDDDKKIVNLPTAEGLAKYLHVSRRMLYKRAENNEEFAFVLERLNQEQAIKLINEGLAGNYNSVIAKLILAKHGYKEQNEEGGEGIKIHIDIMEVIEKIYGVKGEIHKVIT